MKFTRLMMFGTVMLVANGAGAQNSVKHFFSMRPQSAMCKRHTSPALSHP